MIKRAPRQGRSRNRLPNNFSPSVPALTWTAAIVAGKVRITTGLPYTLAGIPLSIKNQAVSPTAITPVTATTFDLTYAATPVATNVLTVGANEPNVRSASGGFLYAGTFTFP